MRSTTENVAGIAATAKALRLAMENQEAFASKTQQMKEVIRKELANYPDVTIFSGEDHFAPHILTFGIKGVRGEVVSMPLKSLIFTSRQPVPARPKLVSQLEP